MMALIDWNPKKMSVGVEALDNDHRKLIEILNNLHDVVRNRRDRETIGQALHALASYADYHFECEERLLKLSRYPGLAAHHEIHEALRVRVAKIGEDWRRSPDSVVTAEIFDFLSDWLLRHILGEDMKYKTHLAPRGAARPEG